MYTQDDNIIIQSYCTASLISELKNNKFPRSEFYVQMNFSEPLVREVLNAVGLENQGFFLMALYSMLVIPKELIEQKYQKEYAALNRFLADNVSHTSSTYREDAKDINFIRHIRNSVAHARVEFHPPSHVIFRDRRGKDQFETHLPMNKLTEFFTAVQRVHINYIADRRKELGQR